MTDAEMTCLGWSALGMSLQLARRWAVASGRPDVLDVYRRLLAVARARAADELLALVPDPPPPEKVADHTSPGPGW